MRYPKSIDLATRLTREGRLTEALAALGGAALGLPAARQVRTGGRGSVGGSSVTAALDASLGAFRTFVPAANLDASSTSPQASDGAKFTAHRLDDAGGSLAYKLYRPAHAGAEPLPLVVMLHGCTQSPDDFAKGTRMNTLAERDGFFVAYPAQSAAANAQKCWNWFRAVDQGRSGEPARIVAMVGEILATHAVDPARVFVAGLSAGGAAAAVLGQAYPEVFAAVGVHSGLACGAARDVPSAFAAMRSGAPALQPGAGIPTIVFHGDRDSTVAPVNGAQVVAQAEPAVPLTTSTEMARSPGGLAYTRTVQTDASGRPHSEYWVLHGAGHAWAGGDVAGSYTDPRGPDASAAMLQFFRQHKLHER